MVSPTDAALLGLIEGLTEFVPVSSTGHLILLGHLLGHKSAAVDAFEIVIQLGALLACVAYYRTLLGETVRGFFSGSPAARRFVAALACGFVPTAMAGFLFHKAIEERLFGPRPVAAALVVGGMVMIGLEWWLRRRRPSSLDDLALVTPSKGFWIGLCQCASLWPGTSRSMASIVGGQIVGLSTRTACDFSFLLGIPTLGAACLYKLVKARHLLVTEVGLVSMIVGLGVAFVVGWLVIALFLRLLGRTGLVPFGIYRIIVGAAILVMLANQV